MPKELIYALIDPRPEYAGSKLEIKYVGLTTNSLAERLDQHVKEASSGKDTAKCRWIRSVLKAGFHPLIRLIEEVAEEDEIGDRERFWIASLKKAGCMLVNSTSGGEGTKAKRRTTKVMKAGDVDMLRRLHAAGASQAFLAERFNVSREVVAGVVSGTLYKQ